MSKLYLKNELKNFFRILPIPVHNHNGILGWIGQHVPIRAAVAVLLHVLDLVINHLRLIVAVPGSLLVFFV